jgi:hypothetical protein
MRRATIPVHTVSLVRRQRLGATKSLTAPGVSDGPESQSQTLVRTSAKIGEADQQQGEAL